MPDMQDKKQILSFILLVVFLGGAGFYIYTDAKKRNGEVLQTPIATSTDSNSEPEYTITQIPVENPAVNIKVPNLSRNVIFTTDISPEIKDIVQKNIARITTSLKEDSVRFGDWLDLGIQYKIAGDYKGAEEAWEYTGFLGPESYIPWHNLGDLYAHYLKDFPKAEQNFKKSIALKPDYIGGYRALYELYYYSYKEKANLATQILKEGLAKNPKSTDLMVLLAQYYKEAGDKDNARTYYQKALTEAKAQGNTSLATLLEQELTNL